MLIKFLAFQEPSFFRFDPSIGYQVSLVLSLNMFRVRTLGGIHLSEIMEYLAEGYAFYPLILNIAKQINNYPLIFCCTWFLNMKRPFFSLKRSHHWTNNLYNLTYLYCPYQLHYFSDFTLYNFLLRGTRQIIIIIIHRSEAVNFHH